MNNPMWQYELLDVDSTQLVCWLDAKIVVGGRLTLEGMPGRIWTVSKRYETTVDKQSLHKPWKVGGIK